MCLVKEEISTHSARGRRLAKAARDLWNVGIALAEGIRRPNALQHLDVVRPRSVLSAISARAGDILLHCALQKEAAGTLGQTRVEARIPRALGKELGRQDSFSPRVVAAERG